MRNDQHNVKTIARLSAFFRSATRHEGGVAAVEFAMIAPILLILMIGTLEMGTAYTIDRRVSTIASSLSDLVARETEVMDDGKLFVMTDKIARALLAPYDFAPVEIHITSLKADGSDPPVTTVDWSKHYISGSAAMEPFSPLFPRGNVIPVPAGLMTPNSYMIAVEVTYDFTPFIFGKNSAARITGTDAVSTGAYTMKDRFYFSPRNTQGCVYHIDAANCSSPM